MINHQDLKDFIYKASRATYASGDEGIKQKQSDSSTTIEFSDGGYYYHDNYFGGEPYGGREVVFLDKKPIWMMVYYGLVHGGPDKDVYAFLIRALSSTTPQAPYRGPELFEDGNWRYANELSGEVDRFYGTERIFKDDACVYEASYIGGFVNK